MILKVSARSVSTTNSGVNTSDLNVPGQEELVSAVEGLDRTEQMLQVLPAGFMQVDVIEFEPVWKKC